MTWGPGSRKVFRISTFEPSSKLPSLSRSHASEATVPSESVEVDVNLTSWPLSGFAGVVVKSATGALLPPIAI